MTDIPAPVPILFCHQAAYGDRVLFGLLTTDGLYPVRIMSGGPMPTPSVARPLFGPKPECLQPELTVSGLEILAVGDECQDALESTGQWMPLLMSMCQDMTAPPKHKLTPAQQAKADRDALMARLGLNYE